MTGSRMRPTLLARAWRAQPVCIEGPITPERLLDRLEDEIWPVSFRHPYGGGVPLELRGRVINCGHVHGTDIRVYRAVPGRSRPFLRRQFLGRVEVVERGGSVMRGELRLSRGLVFYWPSGSSVWARSGRSRSACWSRLSSAGTAPGL